MKLKKVLSAVLVVTVISALLNAGIITQDQADAISSYLGQQFHKSKHWRGWKLRQISAIIFP